MVCAGSVHPTCFFACKGLQRFSLTCRLWCSTPDFRLVHEWYIFVESRFGTWSSSHWPCDGRQGTCRLVCKCTCRPMCLFCDPRPQANWSWAGIKLCASNLTPRTPPRPQINKATLGLLKRVEPYIAWGYPNLKTVRELVYKRGFAKVSGNRIPLTDNRVIEGALGEKDILCVEDLVHTIYTVGPAFKVRARADWAGVLLVALGEGGTCAVCCCSCRGTAAA